MHVCYITTCVLIPLVHMAHKHTPEYSFVSSWVNWLQKKTGYSRHELSFSEGLLKTLYYETDIGSIPRGAHPESCTSKAKHQNNPNWSIHIMGCYWCGRDRTVVNGICCSKECIHYFHEWCVERVELFQGRRFCKLPNCDLSPAEANHVCCRRSHNREYEQMFDFVNQKQLRIVLIKGPSWYNCRHSFDETPPVLTHYTSKPVAETALRDLAKQMKSNLIYYTDIGPIPRSHKTAEHSASHFSKHENWLVDVRGCYLCGRSVIDGCEYLCSNRCYIVFNEWCRRKVLTERGIKYCVFSGCSEVIEHQYSYCYQHHFDNRDKYLESEECFALLQRGPHWYNNTSSHTNTENTGQSNKHSTPDITGLNIQNTINIPQHSKHSQQEKTQFVTNPVHGSTQSQRSAVANTFKHLLVFSETLTDWLYKCSDIGPIPRSLMRYPKVSDMNKPTKSNWNTDIPICYWCCGDDVINTRNIACSEKCFFLFSEWCHKQYYNSTHNKICKICGSWITFFMTNTCYIHSTEYSLYSKYTHLLRSSDYALGPRWYSDTKLRHIDFYNREDPFYEFTNFYPCPRLDLDGEKWKTTEHYFQAQKFVGTPHVECVRLLDTPRSAFEYTRRSEVQRWVRPDWVMVKEGVMLKAVQAKFDQNQWLGQLLVRTGDVQLFEHTRNDKFWGDGGDRKGENKLGKILMQVRFDLHSKCPFFPSRLDRIQERGSNHDSNSSLSHPQDTSANSSSAMHSVSDHPTTSGDTTTHESPSPSPEVMYNNYTDKITCTHQSGTSLIPNNTTNNIPPSNNTNHNDTFQKTVTTQPTNDPTSFPTNLNITVSQNLNVQSEQENTESFCTLGPIKSNGGTQGSDTPAGQYPGYKKIYPELPQEDGKK